VTVEERLQEAARTGEVLKVKYHGGSQPGAIREIAPISIKEGLLWAKCFNSNAVKCFSLGKIEILEGESTSALSAWQPVAVSIPHYDSLAVLLEKCRDRLGDLGWHVEYSTNCLSVHRRFKNGKPLKGPDVSLDFEEYAYDLVVGLDGELHEQNERRRERPWVVRGKRMTTKTLGNLDRAAETFLEWAKLLAPGQT
jgi:hypothetical protein